MSRIFRSASEVAQTRKDDNWGNLTWVAGKTVAEGDDLTLGRVIIKKGEANPRHCHPNCQEALYLISGKLEHSLGDEVFTMEPGDTLMIEAGIYHNAVSVGDVDADMIVAYSSGDRQFKLEEEK